MKGIVLAGGNGTRLAPMSFATSKQLLPVYDKPMIYYPICTLMLAGIQEILIITNSHEQAQFTRLLGDGSQWGIVFEYAIQEKPEGIAQALVIGEDFLDGDQVALILGDNILYGPGLGRALEGITGRAGATIYAYEVNDPSAYGVLEFGDNGQVVSIEEKPKIPKSRYAIPGLYFYDSRAPQLASTLEKSARGEFEITDLHLKYLETGELHVEILGPEQTWVDAGTIDNLFEISNTIQKLQTETGRGIHYPEEVALNLGLLSTSQVRQIADKITASIYGKYLEQVVQRFNEVNGS